MPYAIRNVNGEIIALTALPNREDDTPVIFSDPEVLGFLTREAGGNDPQKKFHELLAQDFQQIRIMEDLIDLLTAKGTILFSELPIAAQEKILRKKTRREEIDQTNDILVDDKPIL
ncbi:hypothetical protein NB640_09515 [Oxalobacter vibrioformis]|uniref:Tryptophan synthase subunit beta like protein n=1 Tax=Oxalobacter vibrioformis TaxID=933080 RepID=A0A9E9P2Y6_9BURK|nr:hypothetical protein [Oxalobacter vibrioformis]WAW09478.1 hypothetical protein NB640_09515 [Oxalobacter vibrioformis]